MGKKQDREKKMEKRNILRNILRKKNTKGLPEQNLQVNVIQIVMYNGRNSKVKGLPLTLLISSTTFTLVSVQWLELILMLYIWSHEETSFIFVQ